MGKYLNISLTPEKKQKIVNRAANETYILDRKVSLDELVNKAIDEYLDKKLIQKPNLKN